MHIFEKTLIARNEQFLGFSSIGQIISANSVSLKIRNIPYISGNFQWFIKTNKTDPDNAAIAGDFGTLYSTGILNINFDLVSGTFTIGSTYYLALRVYNNTDDSQEVIQITFSIAQNAVLGQGANILNIAPIFLPNFTTAQRNALGSSTSARLIYNTTTDQIEQYNPDTNTWSALSGGGSGANLSYTASPTQGVVVSDTGTDATIPAADATNAGLFLPAEKTKLSSITEIFTTALKTAYDGAVTWVTTNGSSVLSHIANTSNPHNVTKMQVGLSNVDNTSDANKPISTATQTALNAKQNTIVNSDSITQGSSNLFLTTAERVKLSNTSGTNTGDQTTITGNAGSATVLQTARNINGVAFDGSANITVVDATKEPIITSGTVNQYFRGDKTFQNLDKTAVGLGNVDNTSDTNKPVSTAQQTALDLKFNKVGDTLAGTAGAGFFGAPAQSSSAPTPSSGFNLFADSLGRFAWRSANGLLRILDASNNTANRVYSFIDWDGEIQLRNGPNYVEHYTDFIASGDFLALANSGAAGAATNLGTVVGGNNRPGIVQCVTGTTSTGRANYRALGTAIVFGNIPYNFECDMQVPTLSDGTNRALVIRGFSDFDGGEPTDGVYFIYSDNINGGRWSCKTRSNSVETAVDSGISVTAAQWYRLSISVNASGTSAVFRIDGSVVATITTNIPTGTARATGIQGTIVKTLGTTALTTLDDWARLQFFITGNR